jgi:hypothetical protein
MNSKWQKFLLQEGANLHAGKLIDFGNPTVERQAASEGNILCDLSHCGLIEVSGNDAGQFMQAQFSNDITQVSETSSQLSTYCSAKGRMLAIFRILKRGERYYLRLPAETLEPFLRRLHMFILRSQVTLLDASQTLVRIGFNGPDAESVLKAILAQVPYAIDECTQVAGLTVIRVAGVNPRYEIYGEFDIVKPFWSELSNKATRVGTSQWSLLDILAGVPTILSANMECFVPQMVNMDLLGGISFNKGCYPGQEIVARTRYLGKLKRRMYRIHIDTDITPQPGDEIVKLNSDSPSPVGRIVEAQPHPKGGNEALAVIQIDATRDHQLNLAKSKGGEIDIETLPYPVDSK